MTQRSLTFGQRLQWVGIMIPVGMVLTGILGIIAFAFMAFGAYLMFKAEAAKPDTFYKPHQSKPFIILTLYGFLIGLSLTIIAMMQAPLYLLIAAIAAYQAYNVGKTNEIHLVH